jgi:glutamine phosphoribosylpyrophosphate amidotransferase
MVMEEESVNAKEMGQAIMNYSRYCLDAAEKSLEELKGKVNIVHVRYQDNVKNPKQEVKKVLEKVRSKSVSICQYALTRFFFILLFLFL